MPYPLMWRYLFLIASLCAASPAWASDQVKRGPAIACGQPEYHVGTIQQGDLVKHIFTMQNKGDAVLSIKRVSGG